MRLQSAGSWGEKLSLAGTLSDPVGRAGLIGRSGLVCSLALHLVIAATLVLAMSSLLEGPPAPALVAVELVPPHASEAPPASPEPHATDRQEAAAVPPLDLSLEEPSAPPEQAVARSVALPEDSPAALAVPDHLAAPGAAPSPRMRPRSSTPKSRAGKAKAPATRDAEQSRSARETPADSPPPQAPMAANALSIRTVKDFLRFQIVRRWRPEPAVVRGNDYAVSLRIALNRDGSVSRADIIDDPQRSGDPTYRAIAESARRAVFLASPLTLPDGGYDEVRDFILDLDPQTLPR